MTVMRNRTTEPLWITACPIELESCFEASGTDNNLHRIARLLRRERRADEAQLFVLPEFAPHGWAAGKSMADWNAVAESIPGPTANRLATLARDLRCWIAGTVFERIPEFPGRHFLTGVLIDDRGAIVLRYRKLYAFSQKTRPSDVYSEYVRLFGRESLFPVVDTPFGKIGMAIAYDIFWPEVPRALAMRGAEILLNPFGSARTDVQQGTSFDQVRRVRAFENVMYVAGANIGPLTAMADGPIDRWPCEIIDFEGRLLAESNSIDGRTASARVDVAALRAHRVKPMANWLAQLQPQLHSPDYMAANLWPLDTRSIEPMADGREQLDLELAIAHRLNGGSAL